ncbi:MAG TPA: uracil-DNA glycosylase [Woeseiaceae bacterium]|nr:uracil-DNA glycosylase [Woeseiaceae bacterium]
MTESFDRNCRSCPRLAAFLDRVARDNPGYYCKPVPPFGAADARLLIVGLAPGMHGANRSGRPFTGDHAGILLYRTLHEFGFSSGPESTSADDGLHLINCRITNAVKCLPPDNKPVGAEIATCNRYLAGELHGLASHTLVLALGGIAHRAVIRAVRLRQTDYPFAHGMVYRLGAGRQLLDSYHCSRYNTNTGRLTAEMFRDIFSKARTLLNAQFAVRGA